MEDDPLFSAHAEVFPYQCHPQHPAASLLRTRGGISCSGLVTHEIKSSSPHTRRYFRGRPCIARRACLFSAHAEVFPIPAFSKNSAAPLLRTRGGISHVLSNSCHCRSSSPHTRRYFRGRPCIARRACLFSAHAEVFPIPAFSKNSAAPLLRTRGGISHVLSNSCHCRSSSPHTRRYFHSGHELQAGFILFSAHAEVFPAYHSRLGIAPALLRTRGGISAFESQNKPYGPSSPHTRRYFQAATRLG